MAHRQYRVVITGVTPLLMHFDNLDWADYMKRWQTDPANSKGSVKGDDRSPAWTWLGSVYSEAGLVVIPADNLMTVLREGGKRCPTGKGQSTFKAQSQSGIVVNESAWPLEVAGNRIPMKDLLALKAETDFEAHKACAEALGFDLFVKRAKIGTSKHVRVRPRFDEWTAAGTLTVFDDMITTDVLQNILTFAGAYAGLGDWRPSAPKSPGPWGKFTATVRGEK
jgi:hypothetical protein